MSQLPICCSLCPDYLHAERRCQNLASPTPANRRRLLTRACNVPSMLIWRFGKDAGSAALLRWIELPGWEPARIVGSFGARPLDRRLWLSRWPYKNLACSAVKAERRASARLSAVDPIDLAVDHEGWATTEIARSLDAVRAIDPIDHQMLLDLFKGEHDGARWSRRLECSPAATTARKVLAIYRFLVISFDVLARVVPSAAACALRLRWFTPGVADEGSALELSSKGLGSVSLSTWRRLYREGAEASLTLLAAPDGIGIHRFAQLETALRRILHLDRK